MKQILKSNIDSNYPLIEIDYHKEVKLYIDSLHGYENTPDHFKVFWLREPDEVAHLNDYIIEHQNMFNLILTTSEKVLNSCNNAMILEFGTAWIFDYVFPEKKFQISTIVGGKEITEGHRLRKKIYYKQNQIKNPIDFYVSYHGEIENSFNNKILSDKKEPLFDSQFHICIENSKQKYWFTEKLIDCFVTKTVPIYYGTSYIDRYFNVKGMMIANSFQEVIDCCNNISEGNYESMLPFIEENYNSAQKFIKLQPRLKELLDEVLKERN